MTRSLREPTAQSSVRGRTVHLLTLVGCTPTDIAIASRARVFEQLLRLSYRDVRHYWSDYFHDARWLAEHLNTVPFSFVYGWSEHGTWIAAGDGAEHLVSVEPGARKVLVNLRITDQRVLLDIESLSEPNRPRNSFGSSLA